MASNKRPKLDIQKQFFDYWIEGLTLVVVVLLIALPAFYYNQLPDRIPIHFDGAGNPDSYGNKSMIWLLPVIGLVLSMILFQVSKYPHTFNYLKPITEENARYQYQIASQLMRVLNLITSSIFCYITWQTIQVGLGNATGLGKLFLFVSLAAMFGAMGFYMFKSTKTV